MEEQLDLAERLLRIGDYDNAWLAIEDLEPIDRCEPPAMDLRLRICIAAGRWQHGEAFARACESAVDEALRITAVELHHGHARHLCGLGRVEDAKVAIARAAELWPPIRGEMLEDRRLEPIW